MNLGRLASAGAVRLEREVWETLLFLVCWLALPVALAGEEVRRRAKEQDAYPRRIEAAR